MHRFPRNLVAAALVMVLLVAAYPSARLSEECCCASRGEEASCPMRARALEMLCSITAGQTCSMEMDAKAASNESLLVLRVILTGAEASLQVPQQQTEWGAHADRGPAAFGIRPPTPPPKSA